MSRFPRPWILVLAMLAVAILTVPAEAQRESDRGRGGMMRGGFRRGGTIIMTVVASKSVKQRLDITSAQEAELEKIAEKQRADSEKRREEMRERFATMSDEERRAAFRKMWEEEGDTWREEAEKRSQDLKKQVVAVLSDEQNKKLRQIHAQILVQTRGPAALVMKPVVDYVGVEPKQIEDLQPILDESRDQMMKKIYREGGRGGSEEEREARRAKIREIRRKTTAKAREILTADQQAKVTELIQAERIELDRPQRRGSRDGFGGRGGVQ